MVRRHFQPQEDKSLRHRMLVGTVVFAFICVTEHGIHRKEKKLNMAVQCAAFLLFSLFFLFLSFCDVLCQMYTLR